MCKPMFTFSKKIHPTIPEIVGISKVVPHLFTRLEGIVRKDTVPHCDSLYKRYIILIILFFCTYCKQSLGPRGAFFDSL